MQVLRSPRAEHSVDNASVRPFEEKLGRRFMITCRSLNLMLQGCINESETGPVTNVRTGNLCFSHFCASSLTSAKACLCETLKSLKASALNLLSRLNRSSWHCPCWTYGKGEKCLQTFTWTLTTRKYVRCSVAPGAEQVVQGLVFWRMACAPLLRGSPETVTSAWTWITGYVFPNR